MENAAKLSKLILKFFFFNFPLKIYIKDFWDLIQDLVKDFSSRILYEDITEKADYNLDDIISIPFLEYEYQQDNWK